jgi:hypothetical protein
MSCSTCGRKECVCEDTLPSIRLPFASEALLPSQALVDAAAEVFDEDENISEIRIVRGPYGLQVKTLRRSEVV